MFCQHCYIFNCSECEWGPRKINMTIFDGHGLSWSCKRQVIHKYQSCYTRHRFSAYIKSIWVIPLQNMNGDPTTVKNCWWIIFVCLKEWKNLIHRCSSSLTVGTITRDSARTKSLGLKIAHQEDVVTERMVIINFNDWEYSTKLLTTMRTQLRACWS